MMAAATNLLSVGYGAIWTALNAWQPFVDLVKLGPTRQVNTQAPGFQPFNNNNSKDRPAVKVGEGRLVGNPFGRNSRAVEIKIAYPIQMLSGAFNVDGVNLLAIVCLQALTNAGPNLGIHSIYRWEALQSDTRTGDYGTSRPEWVSFGSILVTFMFDQADFLTARFT